MIVMEMNQSAERISSFREGWNNQKTREGMEHGELTHSELLNC